MGTNLKRYFKDSCIVHIFRNSIEVDYASLSDKCKKIKIQVNQWGRLAFVSIVFERQRKAKKNLPLRLLDKDPLHLLYAQPSNPVCPRNE